MPIDQYRDIGGYNFEPLFNILDDHGKGSFIKKIEEKTQYYRKELSNLGNFFDLSTGTIIFQTMLEAFNDPDPMRFLEWGQMSHEYRTESKLVKLGKPLGLKNAIAWIPYYSERYNDIFDMSVFDLKDGSVTILIEYTNRDYDGRWLFSQSSWNQGNISGLPRIFGEKDMGISRQINRFSLQELNTAYSYKKFKLKVFNDVYASINGKEFAQLGVLGKTKHKRSNNVFAAKGRRRNAIIQNLMFKREKILTNKNPRLINSKKEASGNDYLGWVIQDKTQISDLLTIEVGEIYRWEGNEIPSKYNFHWENKETKNQRKKEKKREKIAIKHGFNVIIDGYRNSLEEEQRLSQKLQKEKDNLEIKVEERTAELKSTQAKLLEAEKRSLEHRITGGFAHEMRNALTGAQLEFKNAINYRGTGKSTSQAIKDSATSLLKTISNIHEKYNIPNETITSDFIPKIKNIAEISDALSFTISGVSRDINRGLAITSQIRDYAQMSEMRPGDSSIDIVQILQGYGDQYKTEFEKFGIKYSVTGIEKAFIKSNETHLNSIFSNVILNSKDALIDGGIENPQIKIQLKNDEKRLIVELQDNGPGIDDKHIKEIFEPFFSTKPTTGTGLGLGIVKKLVELYDGEIDVESEVGLGTTFKIIFKGST